MSRRVVVVAVDGSAQAWADAIHAAGAPATALPYARVVAPDDPDAVRRALAVAPDLVVATSAHAVAFLSPGEGAGLPAAAVGARTAAALSDAGFVVVAVGDAGFRRLAEALLADGPLVARAAGPLCARVVWLRGATATTEGASVLRDDGVVVEEVVAYATSPLPGFAARAREADTSACVVVLGSGAAARTWLDAVGTTPRARAVAVGATAATVLRDAGVEPAAVAARPAAAAIVERVLDVVAADPGGA